MVDITSVLIIALILLQTLLIALLMKGLNLRIMTIAQLVDERIGGAMDKFEVLAESDDPLGRIKGIIQLFQSMNEKPAGKISAEVIEMKRDNSGKFEGL